jgi:hypothetical protein
MEKTLADVINLKQIVEEVLRDYDMDEPKRLEVAAKVYERYRNAVKIVATRYLEYEAEKRSTLKTFDELTGRR